MPYPTSLFAFSLKRSAPQVKRSFPSAPSALRLLLSALCLPRGIRRLFHWGPLRYATCLMPPNKDNTVKPAPDKGTE